MYKKLLLLIAITLISACSGNVVNDDLQLAAENAYNDADAVVSKAKSYKLNVSDADNQLAQATDLMDQEKYQDSITASNSAAKLASDAISKYESAQEKMALEKATAAKLAEENRAKQKAMLATTSAKSYVVQKGDSLWRIAAASKELDFDPYLWPIIYNQNQSAINDPDMITPAMVLTIKKMTDANQLDKARNHAKKRGNWHLGITEDSDKSYLADK